MDALSAAIRRLIQQWTEAADREAQDDWCNTDDRLIWQAIHKERAKVFDQCAAELAALLAVLPREANLQGGEEHEDLDARLDQSSRSEASGSTAREQPDSSRQVYSLLELMQMGMDMGKKQWVRVDD